MMEVRFRPLDVPAWPQAVTKNRRSPQFRSTWSDTLGLIEGELEKLQAKDAVIEAGFRPGDIRLDGWPRADARAPEFPGVILSFESKFGPLRYLTDAFEDGGFWTHATGRIRVPGWHANLRAIALSLEALRAVDRYGVSRRGEQYTGWNALPPGMPMGAVMTNEDAAALLVRESGVAVSPNVLLEDTEAVVGAYRLAAKAHHPDFGGDPEMFRKITQARDLLVADR